MAVHSQSEFPLNRRNAPRVSRTVAIRYVGAGRQILEGEALDVSETGARLLVHNAPGELTVEFEGEVAVLARTVWEEPRSDGKRVVGVVFEGVHWGLRTALSDYVYNLERRAA